MEYCPIPFNDEARVQAVRSLHGLEGTSHPAVEAICRAACALFDCPTALVSAIADDIQWLPAAVGIEAGEVPRRISLCSFTIMSDAPMIVPDLSRDPRFARHPMVADGGPGFRFYAGVPLVLSTGFRIGSLCALDTRPHPAPAPAAIAVLQALGEAVVATFEAPPVAASEQSDDIRNLNFATLVGHELRTPMTVVLGGVGLLERSIGEAAVRGLATSARQASEHLSNLIETVIRFSVAETGDLVLNEQPACLGAVISETISIIAAMPEAESKTIDLRDEMGDARVLVDRDHMQVILTGLALNAVLHGGREIVITVRRDEAGAACLEVRDSGKLDDKVVLADLYRPFVVGGDLALRDTRGGLGLGLPLTRKLVEMHGGTFEVIAAADATTARACMPAWRVV